MNWYYFIIAPPLIRQIDYANGTLAVYVGEAPPGTATSAAGWRIQKLTYDANSNVLTQLWSPLYATFGDVWNNRAGLTYS